MVVAAPSLPPAVYYGYSQARRRFMRKSFHVPSGRATLAGEIVGRGEPIVFLHARVADRRMWDHQICKLGVSHQLSCGLSTGGRRVASHDHDAARVGNPQDDMVGFVGCKSSNSSGER